MKESLEIKIRLKAIFIYIIVIVACCGMIGYIYKLWQSTNAQREHIEQDYQALALTNELVYCVNEAQSYANLYVISSKNIHLKSFREKICRVEYLIDSLEVIAYQLGQYETLNEISDLLETKAGIISQLNKQLMVKNPIEPINERLQELDNVITSDSLFITTVIKDTVINTTTRKRFWRRLSDAFAFKRKPDTVVSVSIQKIDTITIKQVPEEKLQLLSEVNNAAEAASTTYTRQITAIGGQVSNLVLNDQDISAQISSLLYKLSSRIIDSTLDEIDTREQIMRENYTFSIIFSVLSLILTLVLTILIFNDVNKGQVARKALEQANQRTRQIMDSRHRLLLSVSHDIKTPLGSMLGYLDLWKGDRSVPQKPVLSMQNSGKHILALLENLLEFSSLEQGSLTVTNNNFDLGELCLDITGLFEPLAQQKNLDFKCEFDSVRGRMVYADDLKIRQILINILSNSVKYTPSGDITFHAGCDDQAAVFQIQDSGAGIPADQMEILFKPFSRVARNNSLASGSGLGLFVVKGLVDMLQGKIKITSGVDTGTHTEIVIPVKPGREVTRIVARNMLLIDDDPSFLVMLQDMMVRSGLRVDICGNPVEFDPGMDKMPEYDLVITDMEMGPVTGTDILEKIRKAGWKIPVAVMTGRSDFDKTKATDAGFDDYLPKPVSLGSLNRLTGNTAQQAGELATLEEMFDGDKQAIAGILSVFIGTTTENIVILRKAVLENDFHRAQATCHKMLPMFMQIGLTDTEFLKWMDTLRTESGEKYPFWKGKTTDFIVAAEKMIVKIRKTYLTEPELT